MGTHSTNNDELLTGWAGWSTATVSDANDRQGAMSGIRALSGNRLLGRAFPIKVVAGDSATTHRAIPSAPPGSVLVIDGEGYDGRAIWGEVLTVAALAKGVRGVVVDGVVRDIEAIRTHSFPVFARGTTSAGPHKAGGGRWAVPVTCGGVIVEPGDVILGDEDGVTVVPWGKRGEIARDVPRRVEQEQAAIESIQKGADSAAYFGL